jgi:tRNA-binding protein
MDTISWNDFEKIEIQVGTIIDIQDFPEAKNPSFKIWVDFWLSGIKKTSAQITKIYKKEELIWKQIVGIINFPPKQIGNFMSEFLLTWFNSEDWVVLAVPERKVSNGEKLI